MPFILLITELHDWTFKFCLWGIPNSAIRTNVVKDELEDEDELGSLVCLTQI